MKIWLPRSAGTDLRSLFPLLNGIAVSLSRHTADFANYRLLSCSHKRLHKALDYPSWFGFNFRAIFRAEQLPGRISIFEGLEH
jgi:hypothetical protein